MFMTGFFQDDLNIYYHKKKQGYLPTKKNAEDNKRSNSISCTIIYILKGRVTINVEGQSFDAPEGTVFFIGPKTNYRISNDELNEEELLMCSFFPRIYSETDGDKNFLRIFYDKNNPQIYYKKDYGCKIIPQLFESLKELVFSHYGRVHILSRLTSIISEMCLVYDNIYKADIRATDSISVKIMDYIQRHYFEKVCVKQLQDKYFVSATTINTIVKKASGLTFKEYVTSLRMQDADRLLKNGVDAVKIYNLLGFSDYSSFYRAYKKHFGCSPTQNKPPKQPENKWPLS